MASLPSFLQCVSILLTTFLCYALVHALHYLYKDLTFSLRHIGAPKSASLLLGNFGEMMADPERTEKWRREFGANFTFKTLFGVRELHTSDTRAIAHVFANGAIYQKSPITLANMQRLLGTGLLSIELEEHKRQRRILTQAFGPAQIRLFTDTFLQKATQLRDIWATQLSEAGTGGTTTIDVFAWLRRMTLDVIGEAGFDYQFHSLERQGQTKAGSDELEDLFTEVLHSPKAPRNVMFRLAQNIYPVLQLIPLPGTRVLAALRANMDAIGFQILARSKAAVQGTAGSKKHQLGEQRDLLSILLKANLSPDIKESQRMTDMEAIGQIPTFLFAGHETTSSAVSWSLHALSVNTRAQSKLRTELLALGANPTMEELNALPYLEAVVRETLRLHPPAVAAQRMAMQDDVLPLGKVYVDAQGREYDSLPLRKGQLIHIPIRAVNTDKEIWGADAEEFRPERWEDIPAAVSSIPGVYANLLTFLGGPHSCIGFRFSLAEFKATLFTLLRAFEFSNIEDIGGTSTGLQKPMVRTQPERGSCLPLGVKAYCA
ncbi:cytochrome P450 [Mycena amicta]|nr:cytochrome P450 [Mycena amicta]